MWPMYAFQAQPALIAEDTGIPEADRKSQDYQARRAWLQQEWNRLMSETDPMTMLPNRRALTRQGEELVQLSTDDAPAIALAVIDIDHFKRYHDHLGHSAGDECIRRVGQALSTQARRALDVDC